MKKSQIIGQIFIYLITIVIVAFILFYGYRAINTFKEKSELVSFIQFKNDLQNTIEVLSSEFESVKFREFTIPEDIDKVCLVNNYPELPKPKLVDTDYPIIEDRINSATSENIENVFLIKKGNYENSFLAGKISLLDKDSINQDFLCLSVVSNKINLRMEGGGDHTVISPDR